MGHLSLLSVLFLLLPDHLLALNTKVASMSVVWGEGDGLLLLHLFLSLLVASAVWFALSCIDDVVQCVISSDFCDIAALFGKPLFIKVITKIGKIALQCTMCTLQCTVYSVYLCIDLLIVRV